MTDLEKVIRGLEKIMADNPFDSRYDAVDDAIAMLKVQKAVKPRVSSVEQHCGNCNKVIEMDGWKACPWCGKLIDWEGR